jgi:aldehyde dehydrogenase (NAD+)
MTDTPSPSASSSAHGESATEVHKRLRATFDSGRTKPVAWRKDQLRALRRLLVDGEDELLEALRLDLGKSAVEGHITEVGFARGEVDHALRHLDRWMRPERVPTPLVQQPGHATIRRDPLGVVLVIGPWNYPTQLVLAPLAAALAAGNTAVLKPSEVAAHSSHAVARLVARYLDPDVVAVVEGGVPETTALLAEHWDHIFYTGNGRVGRVVMAAAAQHLTPVTLELGGKSPAIVARDADLDVTARRLAMGKYTNAGQTCIAPDYVLVDRALERPLAARLRDTVREFYGPDPRVSPDYGRIVNERHVTRLVGLLEGDGAGEVIFGGDRDEPARYVAPTALAGTDPAAAIMQEEIFGPLLPILPVDDVDEAIDFVSRRDKPLALYVFTEDEAVADHVLADTTSGGACVNATVFQFAVPALPFGGVGESGMGAYHGRAGFETFSHRKGVLTKSTRLDPSLAYPPYRGLKARLLRRFL